MLDSTQLIRELVGVPGPPGREEAVRDAVAAHVAALGFESRADAKGNLIVPLPPFTDPDTVGRRPRAVVTAHLDEIALMVSGIEWDGAVRVVPLGGLYPWKWGEQPVEIWTRSGPLPGIVSFGSVHTNAPSSVVQQARQAPLQWEQAYLFTGLSPEALRTHGVHPGVRVALARDRRKVREIGPYLASYFLDDRADLAAWLLALEALREETFPEGVVFAATTTEEVGGEGAAYMLHQLQPDVCVALEIGPSVPESPFLPDERPTVWVNDSFSATSAYDLDIIAQVCESLEIRPHWQALTRGGSDASCTAQYGLTARPVTFGLPVENSHGLEIMHRDAPATLARLLVAYLQNVARDG